MTRPAQRYLNARLTWQEKRCPCCEQLLSGTDFTIHNLWKDGEKLVSHWCCKECAKRKWLFCCNCGTYIDITNNHRRKYKVKSSESISIDKPEILVRVTRCVCCDNGVPNERN